MRANLLILAGLLISGPLQAAPALERVATDFERPVWVGAPASDTAHLWVVEQAGTIWVIDRKTGKREEEPFLAINEQVSRQGNEEGLLGLAFAPDYANSDRFYVNFTDKGQAMQSIYLVQVKDKKIIAVNN